MVSFCKLFVIAATVFFIGSSCFPLSKQFTTALDKLKVLKDSFETFKTPEEHVEFSNDDRNETYFLSDESNIQQSQPSEIPVNDTFAFNDNDKEDVAEIDETASQNNNIIPTKPELNDREKCFKLNDQFRDVRVAAYKKLDEIKNFVSAVYEYKTKYPETNLSEFNLPLKIKEVENFILGIDQYYNSSNKFVFIQRMDKRFISSQNGWYPMNAGERLVPLGWEVFNIEKNGNKIALKSRGKYVSSENGKSPMNCDVRSIGEQELFEMLENGDGTYSFKGNNGKFISSKPEEENLFCNSNTVANNEKFTYLPIKNLFDEINISWKYYNSYLTELAKKYDAVVDDKKKIELEKTGNNNETDNKNALAVDLKIFQMENTFQKEIYHLQDMLRSEEYRATSINEMLTKLAPVLALIESSSNHHLSKD